MSGSPADAVEAFGWGPIVSIATTIAVALLGYGASNQKSKQTAEELDDLKKDHVERIKEAKELGERAIHDLASYKEAAREKFVLTDALRRVEQNLSEQIRTSNNETTKKIESTNSETARKIEDLRVEFGKKGIEHTINTALTRGLAQVVSELRQRDGR